MGLQEALGQYFSRTGANSSNRHYIAHLANELERQGCRGIVDKLSDYLSPDKLDDLIAELRLAAALRIPVAHEMILQSGAAADLRVQGDQFDCTIEIEHKSSEAPFSKVFYPTTDDLAAYASGQHDWQQASCELQSVLARTAFDIQPWIGAPLAEPYWAGKSRAAQEDLAGQVGRWLAKQLASLAPETVTTIRYPDDSVAQFQIRPKDGPPCLLHGHGPLEAFVLNDYPGLKNGELSLSEWLAKAVRRKADIAAKYPERCGAQHVVGLVIDEVMAWACKGAVLTNTFLGPLTSLRILGVGMQHYREAPASSQALLEEARSKGRSEMIEIMQYQISEAIPARMGLLFEPTIRDNIDGVIAIYYTGQLQFLPNPFSSRDVSSLWQLFPRTLEPFDR